MGIGKRPHGEHGHGATAIFSAGMKVARSFEVGGRGGDRIGHRRRIKLRPDEMRQIEPQRTISDAADAKRDVDTTAVIVEGDLRGGRYKREVRSARADFMESDADAVAVPDWKTNRADAVAG